MLDRINGLVWGVPMLAAMLGVGGYLTKITGFVQLRLLVPSLKELVRSWREGEGESASFRALCTALAATVGTGNIAGVAGAIALGGPGAVFWMWVSGFVGMATKFAEAALSVLYSENGKSGPMYMIRRGLGSRWAPMAAAYSALGLLAAFGVGNAAQVNAVMDAVRTVTDRPVIIGGVCVLGAALVYAMVSGGAPKIGAAAELLVPAASAVYVALCLGAVVMGWDRAGEALRQIILGAFRPEAVTGGAVGSFTVCLRMGVSRGVFSNEAGMGTAAMAHGTARVAHPARQGMLGIVEVFLDTIVMCTLTALAILVSGVEIPYGSSAGAELTARALEMAWGSWAGIALSICLCCFALATILGWGLYAGRCAEYLRGSIRWKGFALVQALCVIAGTVVEGSAIWSLSEIFNGLMAVPNLICLLLLSGKLKRLTSEFYTGLSGRNVV